jgi:hypothetical protein
LLFSKEIKNPNVMTENKIMRFIFSIALFCGLFVQAQKVNPHDDSFTFELGLPNAFTNKPFKSIMQGLVSATPSYQYRTPSGFAYGFGLQYTYFAINEFRLPSKVYGGMHTGTAFIKLGYEKFFTEIIGIDAGLRAGYVQSYMRSDALLTNNNERFRMTQATYFEPTVSFVMAVDVNSSYRFTVGYPIYGFNFTPGMIGLSENLGYDPADFTKVSSFLTVGFGWSYYFNGKKSQGGGGGDDDGW